MRKTIKQLINFHTSQCSSLDRNTKDAIMHCIFCLFNALRRNGLTEEEWIKCISGNKVPLYCWTKDPIEKLQELKENVYLCTSLSKEGYNENCALLNAPYRYQYVIHLKENTYGILLNAFKASVHPNEEECLIKLIDIEDFKLIKKDA